MSLLLALLLAVPATKEATVYRFDVIIYQGNPDDAKEKRNLSVVCRPQFGTRDNQQAMISVGNQVPIVSDIKKEVGKKVITVSEMQTGIVMKLLPKAQQDGSVFITGSVSLSEAVSDSSILERSLTFHQLFQPGETRIILFYNPEAFNTKTIGSDGVKVRTKTYTGNEMWMEIKVVEPKERIGEPGVPRTIEAPKP